MTQSCVHGVHFIGSVPLSTNEEVFKTLSEALPGRLFSIPDGETGDRDNFIRWEALRFPPEVAFPWNGGVPLPEGHSGIFSLDDVKPNGYHEVAIESYQKFLQLRQKGVIPSDVRFQVSIPVPFECVHGLLRPEFHAQFEPWYEQRVFESIQSILSFIQAEDLAIQFDFCFMVIALEYERGRLPDDFFKPHFSPIREGVLDRAQRLSVQVPSNVPLGWHLCYGDYQHKHFVEPEDLGLLVDFTNDLIQSVPREVSWIHMPVPKERYDSAYLEPLKRLAASDQTKLYLGLVHANDEEGTTRRIQVARDTLPAGRDFGVATECGMGRTPREDLASILKICKDVTEPVN